MVYLFYKGASVNYLAFSFMVSGPKLKTDDGVSFGASLLVLDFLL